MIVDRQIPGIRLGSPPMFQKNAMVLEDEDPSLEKAEAGKGTGNEAHDRTMVRVKTAEKEVENVRS